MLRWLCCTCQVEESYHPHENEHLKSPRNNGDEIHRVSRNVKNLWTKVLLELDRHLISMEEDWVVILVSLLCLPYARKLCLLPKIECSEELYYPVGLYVLVVIVASKLC
ncbi:hypothetical protein ACS0TY_029797 [Phlomoides rotata]